MARGLPDWSNIRSIQRLFALNDIAELAARLRGHNIYNRSGYVVFADDFRDGFAGYDITGTSAGYSVNLVDGGYPFSPFALELVAPTGVGDYVRISRSLWPLDSGKKGLEVGISRNGSESYITVRAFIVRPPVLKYAAFRYNTSGDSIEILTTGGTWKTVATSVLFHSILTGVNMLKMAYDDENDVYEYIDINGDRTLLSEPLYTTSTAATEKYDRLDVEVSGPGGTIPTIRVFSITLTLEA